MTMEQHEAGRETANTGVLWSCAVWIVAVLVVLLGLWWLL